MRLSACLTPRVLHIEGMTNHNNMKSNHHEKSNKSITIERHDFTPEVHVLAGMLRPHCVDQHLVVWWLIGVARTLLISNGHLNVQVHRGYSSDASSATHRTRHSNIRGYSRSPASHMGVGCVRCILTGCSLASDTHSQRRSLACLLMSPFNGRRNSDQPMSDAPFRNTSSLYVFGECARNTLMTSPPFHLSLRCNRKYAFYFLKIR